MDSLRYQHEDRRKPGGLTRESINAKRRRFVLQRTPQWERHAMRLFAILLITASPAWADVHLPTTGNPLEGERLFRRQCVSCHVVVSPDNERIAGRDARTGPNLYGVAGREIGSVPGYNYGDSLLEMSETGTIWTEEDFVGYVQNPTIWLREKLSDRRARSRMAYKVRQEEDARNLYAFLHSVGPSTDPDAAEAAGVTVIVPAD